MKWLRDFVGLVKDAVVGWSADNAAHLAAGLSFFTLLSAAPLLIVLVGFVGIFLDRASVQAFVIFQIGKMAGTSIADAISSMLSTASPQSSSGGLIATLIGFGALIIAAGGMFNDLHSALNRIWKLPPPPGGIGSSVIDTIRRRLIASLMILIIGGVLLVTMVASALIGIFSERVLAQMPQLEGLVQGVNPVLEFGVFFMIFALTYKLVPDGQIPWRAVLPGTLFTTVLFVIGERLINLYLSRISFSSMYGAAGSVIVLLLFVYYSAQVYLLGAEFTFVYASKRGFEITPLYQKRSVPTTELVS